MHSYTYDAENRLVSVDGGATAQYRYDHQNRRVAKIVGGGWTHYIWEGSHVIAEHDAVTTANIYYGSTPYQQRSSKLDYIYAGSKLISSLSYAHSCYYDGPSIICSTTSSAPTYYLSDRLSTRLVLDPSGNVTGRMAHLPFGEDFAESGSQEKHHFTSYEGDSETSLDYAINREHSPALGRFFSVDRKAGNVSSPQRLNRYAYTKADPVNRIDPKGLDDCYTWDDELQQVVKVECDGSEQPGGDPVVLYGADTPLDDYDLNNGGGDPNPPSPPPPPPTPDPGDPPPGSNPPSAGAYCQIRVGFRQVRSDPSGLLFHSFITVQDSNGTPPRFYSATRVGGSYFPPLRATLRVSRAHLTRVPENGPNRGRKLNGTISSRSRELAATTTTVSKEWWI